MKSILCEGMSGVIQMATYKKGEVNVAKSRMYKCLELKRFAPLLEN